MMEASSKWPAISTTISETSTLDNNKAGYVYGTLPNRKSIRIVHLEPGTNLSPIHIALETVPVDSCPEFEALSYVWGDINCSDTITCDGAGMLVTTNVHSALLQLRNASKIRSLWIDAVCIDQNNLGERAYQVTLMQSIYQHASNIIIWLGPSTGFTRDAWNAMLEIEFLEKELLASYPRSRRQKHEILAALPRSDLLSLELSSPSEEAFLEDKETWTHIEGLRNEDVCTEIARLLSHPWFGRSWCVQEAAYGRNPILYCGNVMIHWHTLKMTCLFLREQRGPSVLSDAWQSANNMVLLQDSLRHNFDEDQDSYQDLEYLLPATRHLEATDPRDKVYAFLGLSDAEIRRLTYTKIYDASEEEVPNYRNYQWDYETRTQLCQNRLAIVPDYTIPFEDLYGIITKRLMQRSGLLTMLSHAAQSPKADGLPSWVPDWRAKVELIVLGRIAPDFMPFDATGSSQFRLNAKTELRSLEVVGKCLDIVKELRSDIWFPDIYLPTKTPISEDEFLKFLTRVYEFMNGHALDDTETMTTVQGDGRLSSRSEIVAWSKQRPLRWPPISWLQDYLRMQTGDLSFSSRDFHPGHPAWHFLSAHISPATEDARGGMEREPRHRKSSGEKIPPEYFILASRMRHKRAIFKTEKGYFGICPEWTRPGDWLCYLSGGYVPFVLRPRDEDFILVGESYCHGQMHEPMKMGNGIRKFMLV